ncbi:MAG: alpha/beta fold hydrolase [Balneolaceae bacterium]|nr:alpha/beta fold hydrolase [Balneolaceae bacterium]
MKIPSFAYSALLLTLLLSSLTPVSASAQQTDHRLAGDWEGHIDVQGTRLTIQTHFAEVGDTARTGTIDIPQQGARGLQLVDIAVAGDSVSFRFNAGAGMVMFDGEFSGDTLISGTFHQAGMAFPFELKRVLEDDGEGGEPGMQDRAPEPPPYRIEELSVKNGEVTLAGTLTLPQDGKPAPLLVLLTGSGPQNRDEEIFGFEIFGTLADHLTRNGFAVYRFDDRGVGGSTGDFAQSSMEDHLADTRAILTRLQEHPGVDGERMGLLGHSQGGIIAGSIAAEPQPPVDFVVLMASPARPLADVVVAQVRTLLEQQNTPEALIKEQVAMQEAVFDTLRGSRDLSELKKWMKEQILEQIAALPESSRSAIPDPEQHADNQVRIQMETLVSPAFSSFVDYDPASDLSALRVPALALFGAKDMQVKEDPNAELIRSALDRSGVDYRIEIFPQANHLFQEAESGAPSEYASLEKSFTEGFLSTLTEWLRAQAGM